MTPAVFPTWVERGFGRGDPIRFLQPLAEVDLLAACRAERKVFVLAARGSRPLADRARRHPHQHSLRYAPSATSGGLWPSAGPGTPGEGAASHERSSISATSSVLTVSSTFLLLTPSVSIVMQNGHALAIVVAPVSRSWSVRLPAHAILVLLLHPHLRRRPRRSRGRAAWSSTRARRARRPGCASGSRAASRTCRCTGRGNTSRDRRRCPADGGLRDELALGDEAEQEVRVVDDLDLQAEVRDTRSSAC